MHKRSMLLLSKSRSKNAVEYAPIAKALSTLDPDTASKMKRKFEIAYMLCKEGLAFTKMEAVCELEEKHGVNLGTGYMCYVCGVYSPVSDRGACSCAC